MAKQQPVAPVELAPVMDAETETTTKYPVQTLEDDVDFSRKKGGPTAVDSRIAGPEEDDDEDDDDLDEDEEEEDDDQDEDEENSGPFGVWSPETADKTGLKALVYGPTGGGKTWLAATFPKPVFIDMEKGMRTLFQLHPVLRLPADPNQEIRTLQEVRDYYKICATELKKPNPRIETVVLDSLNELYHFVVGEVLGQFSVNRQYEDQLTMADYGKVNRLFINIIRAFLKLPCHVVMTAVEMPREYEGQETYPKFPGKQIWPELQRMVDQIGYVHVRKGEAGGTDHVVSFRLSPAYIAKDRLGIKAQYTPNNFDAILASIPQDRIVR